MRGKAVVTTKPKPKNIHPKHML